MLGLDMLNISRKLDPVGLRGEMAGCWLDWESLVRET